MAALFAEMYTDGVKSFARRDAAVALGIALNHAVRLKLIPASPAAGIDKPKAVKKEMQFLTDEQSRRLVASARPVPCFALVAAALGTGCRQGELLALGGDDLDLAAGTLPVRHRLSQTKIGFVVREPKTAASRRTVALPGFAVAALAAHKTAAEKGGVARRPRLLHTDGQTTCTSGTFCGRSGPWSSGRTPPGAGCRCPRS